MRFLPIALMAVMALTACTTSSEPQIGPDGRPLPKVYRLNDRQQGKIQFRMLDSVNTLRGARGVGPLTLNAELNAAAATHARDMSVQNRPWLFGSDGSSPIDRVVRSGYQGSFVGQNIRETYETELVTLAAWMEDEGARTVLLDPRAQDMGFAFFQERNGKIWWSLVTGRRAAGIAPGS